MRTRWAAYAGASVTLAAGVILKALHQRPNFYSAAVYLAQSSANLMILTNLVFLTACSVLLGLQKLLYGPLRPIEIEQLYEKAWFAVTETCLAMTIFRGEIGGWFLVMFFSLLAAKVWGWIGEGRVEVLEQQPPVNPRLFHTRLALSLSLSVLFDSAMLEYLIKEVLHQARPDMTVMFGFEFAVLTILSTSTMARYAISLVEIYILRKQKDKRREEIRRERRATAQAAPTEATSRPQTGISGLAAPDIQARAEAIAPTPAIDEPIDDAEMEVEGWDEKGRWIFYLDLTTDFLKLVVYLSFFFILLVFYGLPIHIMRDVFLTCRSFFKRIADFIKYRNATRDMNERYPDATAAEVGREDVCIICREEMRALPHPNAANAIVGPRATNPVAERMRPKKLPCGHILHFACLRSWLERQQICPTCRRPLAPTHRTQIGGADRVAINAIPGQPNLPAPGQAGGDQAHAPDLQPGEGQNRLRMINFGPLRIGFGAGRANLVQDLAQQIQNDPARPGQGANDGHAQQYGFGFGFGRQRAGTAPRNGTARIHTQLEEVEQRLQREINGLRLAANELHIVRMLEAELVRLRNLRQVPGGQQTTVAPHAPINPTTIGLGPPTTFRSAQAFATNTQQPILAADSENLPPGLTLPPGFTLMPLHRIDGGRLVAPGMGTSASAPENPHRPTPPMEEFPPIPLPRQHQPTNGTDIGSIPQATPMIQDLSSESRTLLPNGQSRTVHGAPEAVTLQNGDAPSSARIRDPLSSADIGSSTFGLPSIPSWGANTPLAAPVPSRPPPPPPPPTTEHDEPNGEPSTNGDDAHADQALPKDGALNPTSSETSGTDHLDTEVGDDEPSSSRNKSKAATVEDFIEDVD